MAKPFLMAPRVRVEVPVLMVTAVDAADVVEATAVVTAADAADAVVEAEAVVVVAEAEVVVAAVGVAAVVGEAAEVVVRAACGAPGEALRRASSSTALHLSRRLRSGRADHSPEAHGPARSRCPDPERVMSGGSERSCWPSWPCPSWSPRFPPFLCVH